MWFDQTLSSKEAIENAQMYQLGMKLARLSKEGKEDFHSKAKTVWNFLTKATGILDPKTFQVILHKTAKNSLFFCPHKATSSFAIFHSSYFSWFRRFSSIRKKRTFFFLQKHALLGVRRHFYGHLQSEHQQHVHVYGWHLDWRIGRRVQFAATSEK